MNYQLSSNSHEQDSSMRLKSDGATELLSRDISRRSSGRSSSNSSTVGSESENEDNSRERIAFAGDDNSVFSASHHPSYLRYNSKDGAGQGSTNKRGRGSLFSANQEHSIGFRNNEFYVPVGLLKSNNQTSSSNMHANSGPFHHLMSSADASAQSGVFCSNAMTYSNSKLDAADDDQDWCADSMAVELSSVDSNAVNEFKCLNTSSNNSISGLDGGSTNGMKAVKLKNKRSSDREATQIAVRRSMFPSTQSERATDIINGKSLFDTDSNHAVNRMKFSPRADHTETNTVSYMNATYAVFSNALESVSQSEKMTAKSLFNRSLPLTNFGETCNDASAESENLSSKMNIATQEPFDSAEPVKELMTEDELRGKPDPAPPVAENFMALSDAVKAANWLHNASRNAGLNPLIVSIFGINVVIGGEAAYDSDDDHRSVATSLFVEVESVDEDGSYVGYGGSFDEEQDYDDYSQRVQYDSDDSYIQEYKTCMSNNNSIIDFGSYNALQQLGNGSISLNPVNGSDGNLWRYTAGGKRRTAILRGSRDGGVRELRGSEKRFKMSRKRKRTAGTSAKHVSTSTVLSSTAQNEVALDGDAATAVNDMETTGPQPQSSKQKKTVGFGSDSKRLIDMRSHSNGSLQQYGGSAIDDGYDGASELGRNEHDADGVDDMTTDNDMCVNDEEDEALDGSINVTNGLQQGLKTSSGTISEEVYFSESDHGKRAKHKTS